MVGVYIVSYKAVDAAGYIAVASREVTVVDSLNVLPGLISPIGDPS